MSPRRANISDEHVFSAIVRLKSRNGVAPTYRELAVELGLASWSSARYRVLQLEVKEKLTRTSRVARGIAV